MPDRSKEELKQIYNDLLEFRNALNKLHNLGELWPTPMNGKKWEEEKDEFWGTRINKFSNLNRLVIKSCEVKTLIEAGLKIDEKRKSRNGFWNHVGVRTLHSSEYDFGGQSLTLDEMIEIIEKDLKGNGTKIEKNSINQILDNIGTSACEPRAFLQENIDVELTNFQDKLVSEISPKSISI